MKITKNITKYSQFDPNLVLWLRMQESPNAVAFDYSGSSNHGIIYAATWSSQGLIFNGVNSYVDVGNKTNLQITGAISLAGWVRIDDLALNSGLFGRGRGLGSSGNYGYFLTYYAPQNAIYFDTYSTTTRDELYDSNAIIDNNWHNITATWDGTASANGKKIYIDGVITAQKTSIINIMGNPAYNFRIGRDSIGSYTAKAAIDDVKVYNKTLSQDQIHSIFQSTRSKYGV